MPAGFAHDSFGKIVYKELPDAMRLRLGIYQEQFRFGLQGPDVLFHYNLTCYNRVNTRGVEIHKEPARKLFEPAIQYCKENGIENSLYSYMMGCVCHFALDSAAHPYVNASVNNLGVSHSEIESEFEKFLLKRAGRDPHRYYLSRLIPRDRETAQAMQIMYRDFTEKEMMRAMKDMSLIRNVLVAPTKLKKNTLLAFMHVTGRYDEIQGQVIRFMDNPICEETNKKLFEIYKEAVPEAVNMILNVHQSIFADLPLPERFDRTFE